MTATQRIIVAAGAFAVVFAVFAALFLVSKAPPRVVFACAGISRSSNTNLISIAITNQSTSSIVYFVGEPVLKSNGVWGGFSCPMGTKLVRLSAGQSARALITAPAGLGEARVPVLWGFTYSPNANRWQEIQEDVVEYFRMHDYRGRGALYTNYVAGINL